MIKSMTGYGKAVCKLDGKQITIEIKSLNSKSADIYTRLPNLYREKDLEIRNIVNSRLGRGKIELILNAEATEDQNSSKINLPVVQSYYKQLKELETELGLNSSEELLQVLMRLPDTLKTEKEELDPEEWSAIVSSLNEAIDAIEGFRVQEGQALEKDIRERICFIEEHLSNIKQFEEERIEKVKQRISNNLNNLDSNEKIDENRLEQELIYYLEKLDITEEKVRLANHCNYFKEVMDDKEPGGKKLGFISQEIGREINTIGSKASHSEIQKFVVMMKDELEKIKEQLMNVL